MEIATRSDHDLLIRLDTQIGQLLLDVKSLRDDTRDRINALELQKANAVDLERVRLDLATSNKEKTVKFDAIEMHLSKIDTKLYAGIGATMAIQFVIPIILHFWK